MSSGFNHGIIEKSAPLFVLMTVLTIAIGGLVQIIPLFQIEATIEPVKGVRPYSPLELAGRNIYMREGCYNCHSQMIRPFRDEVDRYGHYSLAAESRFDHPFLWGSKRTGPDLARIGGKYSNAWHTAHLINPRDVLPGSIMPPYGFLKRRPLDPDSLSAHLATLQKLGVPYSSAMITAAAADARAQADPDNGDAEALRTRYPKAPLGPFTGQTRTLTEMDALIAYLQVLGTLAEIDAARPEDLRQTK